MQSWIFILAGGALVAGALLGCGDNLTPQPDPEAGDGVLACLPNLDGQLDADELPVALEVSAEYDVSPPGTAVDLVGLEDAGGRRLWDFAAERPEDERRALRAAALGPQWYASAFGGGQFVVPADPAEGGGHLDGVYSKDDRGLWLHGLASREPDPARGRTLLVYERPVALFRFPLRVGSAWVEEGVVSGGLLDGLPYNGTDTYRLAVDAVGEVRLPYVVFEEAYRVRSQVVVAPAAGGVTRSQRQVFFLFECFGEVVRVTSAVDEEREDFAVAEEVRRWAL